MSTLRVALIGYGLAGRSFHRPLLLAEPRFAVTHVVTGDPQRQVAARAELPGARLVPEVGELWAAPASYDVVVVATPHASHAGLAAAALELGKPTVVDKPLALSAGEAAGLVAQAGRLGVPLSVFHNRRWDSDTLDAAAVLATGELGRVHRLQSRFTRFRPEIAASWREQAGSGGVLLDLGTHLVDQALHLLGPATAVYAEVRGVRPGAGVDDDAFLALTHRGGTRSHLWASAVAPVPGPRLVLQGDRAGWVKDTLDGQEEALRSGGQLPVPEPPGRIVDATGSRNRPSRPGDWGSYYRLLADALLTGSALPVPAEDGLAALTVLEAAARSARTGAVVGLPSTAAG